MRRGKAQKQMATRRRCFRQPITQQQKRAGKAQTKIGLASLHYTRFSQSQYQRQPKGPAHSYTTRPAFFRQRLTARTLTCYPIVPERRKFVSLPRQFCLWGHFRTHLRFARKTLSKFLRIARTAADQRPAPRRLCAPDRFQGKIRHAPCKPPCARPARPLQPLLPPLCRG